MNLSHPSTVLKQEWTELIRNNAGQAEKGKRLTKQQMELITSQDWFRPFVSTVYGGKQKAYPDVLQLVEALAWADASVGWVVATGAASSWHGAFIDIEVAKTLFPTEKTLVSTCRAATGTAELLENGSYKISGSWKHATACVDAASVIGNCVLTEKGAPILDEKGNPKTMAFVFHKNEIAHVTTFKSMGMLATANDGFEVKDLTLPANRGFRFGENQKVNGNLYHFPYQQLLEAGLAAIVSGITLHFIDLCEAYFATHTTPDGTLLKDDRVVAGNYDRLMRKFDVAREKLFYGVSILWQSCVERKPLYPSVLNKVSSATGTLTQIARETVNDLYPFCGLTVTETDTEINRVWRDFQTATQNDLLVFGGL